MTQGQGGSFPFLCLPVDLQHQICALFCDHCTIPATVPLDILKHTAGDAFRTLKALSETCRSLSHVAQPLLYHCPDVKCYTSLFQTLSNRPDLANNVFIFARLYESIRKEPNWDTRRAEREDWEMLKALARKLDLRDPDDAEYEKTFQYLAECEPTDQGGSTQSSAKASFGKLITAMVLVLAPRLQFVVIDIDDGVFCWRHLDPVIPFPFLPRWLATTGRTFSSLRTIVVRNAFHHRPDNLGIEAASFLFDVTPNVRSVVFQFMGGFEPRYYDGDETKIQLYESNTLLKWPALGNVQQLCFDPCVRHDDAVPCMGIRNMVQKCSRLQRFMFRLRYPANKELFLPTELMQAVLPARTSLEWMELFCSDAKIPYLRSESLLTDELKHFTSLQVLVLDEQLFCGHWNSKPECVEDDCLVRILPETVTTLTIRLHDKFKAVPDLVRLGTEKKQGSFPRLIRVQVDVLQDLIHPVYQSVTHYDPPGFDHEYLLFGLERAEWGPAVMKLTEKIRPVILTAFEEAECIAVVDYLEEQLFAIGEEHNFPPAQYV